MAKEIKALSPLEWKVYRTIKRNTYSPLRENKWTSQLELVEAVNSDLTLDEVLNYNEKDYNHCRALWTIVNRINQSGLIPKIIVIKDYHYKLGNKAECKAYFAKQRRDALGKLTRLSTLERRMNKNGQGTILDNNLKPITDESSARKWLETLVPDVLEIMKEEEDGKKKNVQQGSLAN